MRVAFDLFPCQTGSRLRGIGRFTYALAAAMARRRGEHEMHALANGLYPESTDLLRQDFKPMLPPGFFCAYTHPGRAAFSHDGVAYTAVATTLIHRAYQDLAPDAVICANPFEGWQEPGVAALPHGDLPAALRVAIVYDFIPALFPDQYLHASPGYKDWYLSRMESLREFDLLLAISESTRHDAIRLLGVAPQRVVNIAGAASPAFHPAQENQPAAFDASHFGITRPFVLYTGNVDYRKNLHGLLQAYALLPDALRRTHQLVLNQVGDITAFRRDAHALGLRDDEVVTTGHISDDELLWLYRQCKLFVFPSLYEGFGLPILEAMACGAPVIAGDNSSIPELVGRSDMLFDAADPSAIAAALRNALADDLLRKEFAAYGIERARRFTWDDSAMRAWQAIEHGVAQRRAAQDARVPRRAAARIAMVCSSPWEDRPAARHCVAILPLLARDFDVDLFVEQASASEPPLPEGATAMYSYAQLPTRHAQYAAVVFQIANDAKHAFMLPLLEQCNGIVVMHDLRLDAPVKALARSSGREQVLHEEVLRAHGLQGLVAVLGKKLEADALQLNRTVLESAQYLALTSETDADLLRQAHRGTWLPPLAVLPDGDAAAAAYAHVIRSAMAGSPAHTIAHLADALGNAAPDEAILNAIALHAVSNRYLRKRPRLLLDVTQLAKTDARSGIQRVVKNIAREIAFSGACDRPLELVRQADGKLWRASEVIAAIFDIDAGSVPNQQVLIHPGDTLLMIDSSWEQYEGFRPIFEAVRQSGGMIVTVIYDLIPLRLPDTCSPGLVAVFNKWIALAFAQSDMLLCISRAVADDVWEYLAEHDVNVPRKLHIAFWPLGADIGIGGNEASIRAQVRKMTDDPQSPLFLMVGTIEPRKGHDFVLDAFESLWRKGQDLRLCIAGAVGWMVGDTVRRIREHPQFDKKLFFVERFTDAEINVCYAAATGLIAASRAEGFGLPIVEAALHQVPVLASDIPVFREVGGDGAIYFSLHDCEDLAAKIIDLARLPPMERKRLAGRIRITTWRESARHLLETVLHGQHVYRSARCSRTGISMNMEQSLN